VWWQYIVGELAAAAVIACFVVLVRFMSQQMTGTAPRTRPGHLITAGTAPGRVPRWARSGRPAVQQAVAGGLRLT